MYRYEIKRLFAILGIIALVGWSFLTLVAYGPLLQDQEFEDALVRAQEIGIKDVEQIRSHPFGFMNRTQAAHWYVAFAQSSQMTLYSNDICEFDDIQELPEEDYDMVMLACGYRFFRGSKGGFYPQEYVTKAMSLVALMKGFYPKREFEETEPYRDPFVNLTYSMGVTKRKSNPYMMYLIPKYELLLQLYRAYNFRIGNGNAPEKPKT